MLRTWSFKSSSRPIIVQLDTMNKILCRLILVIFISTVATILITTRGTSPLSRISVSWGKWTPNPTVDNIAHQEISRSSLMQKFVTDSKNSTLQDLKLELEAAYLKHARVLGRPRLTPVLFTIGIPTTKRPQPYLWQTMDSLLKNCNNTEKADIVIVIMLSDFEPELRKNVSENILKKYKPEIDSGLIHVIEAPRKFYPRLKNLKRTYNHPMARVVWRAKQNIDFAFMMKYSQNISKFYLQLEDDVTTVPNYIAKMKDFIHQQKNWVCLEFSSLGFIAKLFHNYDLQKLADMLMLFYEEQPNDVTYLSFDSLMMQRGRRIRKPTLFQHHGYHSSLLIKKVGRKDLLFKNVTM